MTRAREKALEESGLSHGHITEATQIILADEFDTNYTHFATIFLWACAAINALSLSPLMHFTSSPDGRPLALLVVNRTW